MNCPFCNKTIFHLGAVAEGIFGVSSKDTSMYHKDGNQFVDCPSCSKSVLMEQCDSPVGKGMGYRIAPNQSAQRLVTERHRSS